MTDYTVAVLEDAISILELLQCHEVGLSLADITAESGFVKNKVFRILYTLEKHHLVDRNANGNFRLGLRFLEFGQHVQQQTTLLAASEKVMDRLVSETGESIFLGIVSGWDALCVAVRESPQSVRLYAELGRRAPLHSGGVPKILFAFLPHIGREATLGHFFADNASAWSDLDSKLAQVRAQGYVVVVDELDMGAHSVAAPIRDYSGGVIAALSIAGPSHRFPAPVIDTYIDMVMEAAAEISLALGYKDTIQQRKLEMV